MKWLVSTSTFRIEPGKRADLVVIDAGDVDFESVGAAAMAHAKATTLILVTNTVAGRQWKRELIARTVIDNLQKFVVPAIAGGVQPSESSLPRFWVWSM